MPPIAFLALLTIALLAFAAFRLELDFRRTATTASHPGGRGGGEPEESRPQPRPAANRPELRASPAGGYWQAPFSRAA